MEKLTAEEILNNYYAVFENESIIEAMKAYALQEVKKHLEIAAEEAVIFFPSHHLHGTKNIYKHSITGIKIELT